MDSAAHKRTVTFVGIAVAVLGVIGFLLLTRDDSFKGNEVEQVVQAYIAHLQDGDAAGAAKLQAAGFSAPSAAELRTLMSKTFDGRSESMIDGTSSRACVVRTDGLGVMSDRARFYVVREQSAWKVETVQVYSLATKAAEPPWPETWVKQWRSYPSDPMPLCHDGY